MNYAFNCINFILTAEHCHERQANSDGNVSGDVIQLLDVQAVTVEGHVHPYVVVGTSDPIL